VRRAASPPRAPEGLTFVFIGGDQVGEELQHGGDGVGGFLNGVVHRPDGVRAHPAEASWGGGGS